ncbi:uncharacterized protein LOC141691833 [Apium graveolens]|uniref:uncharacterized protein LOC141691833 n=1 Tax=Apium graveolens TaxID=4045 RepID=UPI003D79391E
MVSDWREAQSKAQGYMQIVGNTVAKGQVKWQKTPSGWYKVNADAAIQEGSTWFKVGMVLKNDKGEFVSGMHKGFEEEVSIPEAEAIGLYEALMWIDDMGIQQVILECDSLVVVNALIKSTTFVSEVGTTLEFCRSIFR